MPDTNVITIAELGEIDSAPNSSFIPIDDGELTSKITVENFNASSTATATAQALKSEGYAVGTQDGEPDESGPYYHNNAKYYKEVAQSYESSISTYYNQIVSDMEISTQKAGEASASAESAAASAVLAGQKATAAYNSASTAASDASSASASSTTATAAKNAALAAASDAQGYKNDAVAAKNAASAAASDAQGYRNDAVAAKNAAEAAAASAAEFSVRTPYIGANGNWYVYDTTTSAYVDSGIDASITMRVGTVTTLEAGQPATVTNSGTSTDAIFNFGIPQGIQGIQGPQGERGIQGEQGIQGIQGETGATGATPNITMTATADAVSSENPSVNITKSGTAENPSFALAFSGLKGTKGDTGATGQTGQTGPAGADGFSPEVTISSIAGGHRVTITDEDHPTGQSFDVMDGAGSGDMLAAIYDPDGDVATAGGIADYVDDAIDTAITSALTASY